MEVVAAVILRCSHSVETQKMDLIWASIQKNQQASKWSQRFQIKSNRIQIKINGQQWLLWYLSYYIVTVPKVLAKPLISGAPLMRSPYHYVSSQALVIMLISFLKVQFSFKVVNSNYHNTMNEPRSPLFWRHISCSVVLYGRWIN